ncbi:MAG: hypothetical protein ACMVP2_27825 [Imperialibacter sp.]|uniref:hypothetical protein n=1 Tax=Imperialibacter sp. TaxID=2038411 RepID=UPI003A89BE37|tara:strand:- start:5141 stop:5746 length:606 start_codon:yes stop_codon:yes gene_type:complete
MKKVLFISFMLLTTCSFAQPAFFYLKNTNVDTVRILSHNTYKIQTDRGDYKYGDLTMMVFPTKDDQRSKDYSEYANRGIIVRFINPNADPSSVTFRKPEGQSQVVSREKLASSDLLSKDDLIVYHLTRFNNTRLTGKFLQTAGIVLSLGSALVYAKHGSDSNIASSMVIAGGLFSIVGFGIDISASKHLNRLTLEYSFGKR